MTSPVRSTVEQVIREILPELRDREIPVHKHLKDLGADSVDRVEIVLALIDRLHVTDSMSSFADLRDVGELVSYLEERTGHDRR